MAGIAAAACFFLSAASNASDAVTSAADLVTHHLDSIGDAKTRAGIQSRAAAGTAHFHIMVGGGGSLDGKSQFVSEGGKFHFMMKFANNEYRGEHFIFDGKRIQVSTATATLSRSELGGFLYSQDAVLREGFWGGILSTAWPLLDLDKRKAKLTFDGIKKIDGQGMYELRYQPKKDTDLEIRLYFDPATFHHVRTVYTLNTGMVMASETTNARQEQTRYHLEERFSDFQTIEGLSLPARYDIRFTEELQSGSTTSYEWEIVESSINNNISLDARNFDVK
jgi:hypothetical protein